MNVPGAFLLWAMTATADPAAGQAPPSAPQPPPAQASAMPPPPPFPQSSAFRLGLSYTRVLAEDGDLTNGEVGTNAVGLVFISPSSSYVRNHFAVAHQWESAGPGSVAARGFRVDLISFGYPIHLLRSQVRLDLEPILTAVRGEIMFTDGGKFLRLESGFGLELSATFRHWFLAVQPLAIDFRYWFYGSSQFMPQSQTGLGRLFPFRATIGYEF